MSQTDFFAVLQFLIKGDDSGVLVSYPSVNRLVSIGILNLGFPNLIINNRPCKSRKLKIRIAVIDMGIFFRIAAKLQQLTNAEGERVVAQPHRSVMGIKPFYQAEATGVLHQIILLLYRSVVTCFECLFYTIIIIKTAEQNIIVFP